MPPFWIDTDPLVLASGSTARRALLTAAAVPHEVHPAAIDERAIDADLRRDRISAADIANRLAEAKACAISDTLPQRLVLGADQTLALGARMLTKPVDLAEARGHLEALAGRTHTLHSGWALVRGGTILASGIAEARMHMRALTPAFLDAYLDAVGPDICTSVGGYKLEGLGIHLFERIEGDQTTVLGLPLLPVLTALRQIGVLLA